MADRYSLLLDENTNLKRALSSSKSALERTSDDFKTLKLIHEELKTRTLVLEKENRELVLRLEAVSQEKKEIELQFDTTIRNLKSSIEQKQREIEEVQTKVIPILDQDMIKIKLINELEVPHRLQLEAKLAEIERLQEDSYDLKKQLEVTMARNESLRQEKDKEIKAIQAKNKTDLQELMKQIEDLTARLEDNTDKGTIRSLRKDNEELKLRLQHKDSEIDEVHSDLTRAKEEKQQLFMKLSAKLDQEKDERLQAISSKEKLSKRVFLLEEDVKKLQERLSQKALICERLEKELNEARLLVSNREEVIKGLYKKIDERFEENVQLSQKHKDEVIRLSNESESQRRTIEAEKGKLIDRLQLEVESLNEARLKFSKESEMNKKTIAEMDEEIRNLSFKNEELIRKLREVEMANQENQEERMKVQASLKAFQRTMRPEQRAERDEDENLTFDGKKPSGDQNQRVSQLKEENSKMKLRVKKYGDKLSLANKKILDLMKEKAGLIQRLRETQAEKPWENYQFRGSKGKEIDGFGERYTRGRQFDDHPVDFEGDERVMGTSKSPLTALGYDPSKVSYKDDVLLEEIQRNISRGMEFYKI